MFSLMVWMIPIAPLLASIGIAFFGSIPARASHRPLVALGVSLFFATMVLTFGNLAEQPTLCAWL
ncbi:MAG: hypothetical protein U1D30_10595 [Planctomycetota bacterium]